MFRRAGRATRTKNERFVAQARTSRASVVGFDIRGDGDITRCLGCVELRQVSRERRDRYQPRGRSRVFPARRVQFFPRMRGDIKTHVRRVCFGAPGARQAPTSLRGRVLLMREPNASRSWLHRLHMRGDGDTCHSVGYDDSQESAECVVKSRSAEAVPRVGEKRASSRNPNHDRANPTSKP